MLLKMINRRRRPYEATTTTTPTKRVEPAADASRARVARHASQINGCRRCSNQWHRDYAKATIAADHKRAPLNDCDQHARAAPFFGRQPRTIVIVVKPLAREYKQLRLAAATAASEDARARHCRRPQTQIHQNMSCRRRRSAFARDARTRSLAHRPICQVDDADARRRHHCGNDRAHASRYCRDNLNDADKYVDDDDGDSKMRAFQVFDASTTCKRGDGGGDDGRRCKRFLAADCQAFAPARARAHEQNFALPRRSVRCARALSRHLAGRPLVRSSARPLARAHARIITSVACNFCRTAAYNRCERISRVQACTRDRPLWLIIAVARGRRMFTTRAQSPPFVWHKEIWRSRSPLVNWIAANVEQRFNTLNAK